MGGDRTPPRLLVVSGDADLREVLTTLLSDEGYELRVASTLEDAMALGDEMAFALALADLHAGVSRYSFAPAHVLRRRVRPTPVALLTTESRLKTVDRAGFAFVQQMPFDVEALLGAVATALDIPLCEERQRRAEVVRRYFAALEAEDWPALLSLCTEDVAYYPPRASIAESRRLRGKDALRDYVTRAAAYYRCMSFRDMRFYDMPKGLAARYTGHWVTPDDTRRQAAHTTLFSFEGELIARVGVRVHLAHESVRNGALGGCQAG